MSKVPYASAVGSLMYSMVCTRPDLAYAASLVSRFMANPGRAHWDAVKWVLRYMKGTSHYGLLFKESEGKQQIIGYCDSDFSGDLDKRRSLTGYLFTLFGNIVSWKACLQPVVALSTTEAEYVALTEATKEALWLQGLVGELGIKQEQVQILCDSQSAIYLTKNQMFHEKTKHIDVKLHFLRDIISSGKVMVEKIHTDDNLADIITKPVTTIKFRKCLNLMGVTDLESG